MKVERLELGCKNLDDLLGGGVEKGVITNFYGEAGSGKSNIALMATVRVAEKNKKVIFIDTEGSYSVERIAQISRNFEKVNKNTIILEPKDFEEQQKIIESLNKKVDKETGLIVLDSLVALYRIALTSDKYEDVNRKLAAQLSELSKIARQYNIPIIITTQVYSDINGGGIEIVSKDVAKYWSKCLVLLEKEKKNLRKAKITKHRSRPEGLETYFLITEKGLDSKKDQKPRLF